MSIKEYKDMVIKVVAQRPDPNKPMKMSVKSGKLEFLVDKLGGEAPSPLEYLLASLAGCINIVGSIVAKEMGIKIEDLKIEVEGVFNPTKLFTGKGERAGFKKIKTKIYVKSDTALEKLEEWLKKVEDRCPIGDNLVNPTDIETSVEKM